jgi:hypothetical protein
VLYGSFACYAAATVVLCALSYGSIMGYVALGTIAPGIALLALIGFQVSARPRCSALAFCLVFAGLLGVAFVVLYIAAAASASV